MLKQQNRLSQDEDFRRVFQKGVRAETECLYGGARKNRQKVSRFGFSIAKRISSKATVRNLLKRRLGAAIERLLSRTRGGYDVVVVAKPKILDCNFVKIQKEVQTLLSAMRVLPD